MELYPSYALSKLIIKEWISSKIRMNKYDLNSYLEFAKILAQEVYVGNSKYEFR